MKKKISITILCSLVFIMIAATFTGCGYNKQLIDLNYKFDKAYIEGIGEVNIKSWNDYENSDMVQVIANDGTVYLTHSSNVILVSD